MHIETAPVQFSRGPARNIDVPAKRLRPSKGLLFLNLPCLVRNAARFKAVRLKMITQQTVLAAKTAAMRQSSTTSTA